ncbi:ArdC family protein [Virgibacillus siamensis]|uniref:ArdC family protein n=1 Tax=Virgibacillus siamensis TaxID=480071 RepID=UPI000984D5C9|nr:zincin-like metallopeptidase domain-containing protein [Virgibacillus siamensis]
MSKKIYEMITNQIIEKLEEGTVPWKQPFKNGIPIKWKSQKPYRGINLFLLDGGEYASFKQITEAGGSVKKGEKGQIAIFFKMLDIEDEETGEKKTIPFLRYHKVFKVGEQTEGIEPKQEPEKFEHDPIKEAEEIINGYFNPPSYSFHSGGAWYKPFQDHVNVPPKEDFESIHEYYSTFFHEIIHSTGHKERLSREGVTGQHRFGTKDYSKEELVAEIGASMLCGVTGIENETIDNSASYISGWLQKLKNDKTLIVKASQQAQKASDHIRGIEFQ